MTSERRCVWHWCNHKLEPGVKIPLCPRCRNILKRWGLLIILGILLLPVLLIAAVVAALFWAAVAVLKSAIDRAALDIFVKKR